MQELRVRAAYRAVVGQMACAFRHGASLAALLLTVSTAPMIAQTVGGSNPITISGAFGTSAHSAVVVSSANIPSSATVTAISLNFSGLNVTNLNSVAMALKSPSGTSLDLISGVCDSANASFTLADTGATGPDNVSGMVPYLGGTCPSALSGTYLPTDYFPDQDIFNPPGPSTYDSAGIGTNGCDAVDVSCGTFNFASAFSLPASGSSVQGTWTLYIANQSSSGFTPSGALGSWTLTFTVQASTTATTTSISSNPTGVSSTVFTTGNVGNQSATGTPVTLTATVSPIPSGGTVTFYDSTFSAAGSGTALSTPVAVNGSGQAQTSVTFPPSEEGTRKISAVYSGTTGFAGSTTPSAGEATVLTVNHPYNPSGATFCNGPVTINNSTGEPAGGTGGFPYPSQLVLGNGFSQLQGTIESVTVTLNGLQAEDPNHLGFVLQAPNGGNAFEFLSWTDGPGGSASSPPTLTNLNLTLSDTGSGALQTNPQNQEDCSSSACRPADDYSLLGPLFTDTFPSPAPTTIGKALPTGSATFLSEFGGGGANGTWQLYLNNWIAENPSTNASLPYGQVNEWCLNFTMQVGAHPTTTSVSGSPNPASFTPPATTATVPLTANVSVTDGSGFAVNAGTVTFVDGATTLGTSPVSSTGQATLNAPLAEGTHQIVASYSGTNTGTEFGISTGTYDQRVDTVTANPVSASGAGPYTYCNTGAIKAPGLGLDAGAASPYPSNIFVTNLPGTVDAVTVTLNGFSTDDQGDLMSLLVGPGGNNLDFFSLTGSNDSGISPINLTFADSGSSIGGNLTASGTYRPTSFNTSIKYPQCPPNASNCASPAVGPPLPSNPFTPTNKAESAGTGILGNTSAEGVFGGTSSSTYNGNGTWSLYLDDGGPTGGGELTNLTGGWCVNFTENLPAVSVVKSHSGSFTQGQQGVPFMVDITNNGPGATGDPTGGSNPLTVTDTLSSAFTYAGFSGTGWSCVAAAQTVTCKNDSAVLQGGSYEPLTIDVNVSPTASTTVSVSNQVQVSGGGATAITSNTDTVTILPAAVLAIQKTHAGTFTQGQTGLWNITVSNSASGGSTTGTITVSDSLPVNYTLASYTSTGNAWTCSGTNVVTCTTSAGIAGGASSTIALTANIPATSAVSVSNTATAWGGGDLTHTSSATAVSATDTATILQVPAGVTINNSGGTQSATIGAAFSTALSVTVKDANSVAIPNSSVIFTANAGSNGQSGIFSNSTGTLTVATNASGVANAGTFTADLKVGSYTVTAVAGSASATFNLTNTSGAPTTITLTSGSGQSAAIHTAFASPLIATVTDAGGNPLSGVTVVFSAPTGLTSSVAFSNASNTISVATNSLGQANAGPMTANGIAGGPYNVQAAVSAVTNNFQLTNLENSLTTFAVLSPNSATVDVFGLGLTPPTGQLAFTDLTSSSAIAAPVTLNSSTAVTSLLPETTTSTGANTLPDWTVLGDVNGDGKLDLITSVYQTDSVSVQFGNGDGTFQSATSYLISSGFGPAESHLFSLRGNGVLDIVVASFNSNRIAVLLGNANGTFQSPVFYTMGTAKNFTLSIAAGDFNHDGNLDVAVVNGGDNTVSIALGNGSGGLSVQSPPIPVGNDPVAIRAGDFNADGYMDLAVANYNGGTVTTLLNNQNGTFTPTTFLVGSGVHSGPEALAIQGTGSSLQLAVANYNDNTVSVYNSNGNGTFGAPKITAVGKGPDDLNFASFNGVEELVVSNYTDGSVDLLVPAGSAYTLAGPFKVGSGPYSAAVGDIDSDGTPDVVVSNCFSNNTGALLSGTQISIPYTGLSLVAGHSIQAVYTRDSNSKYGSSSSAVTAAP
jgi:hypothetical protein